MGNKIRRFLYMYEDKTLNCRDCGDDFSFTASEQEFYAEKGFTNEPGRCPDCRAAKKRNNNGGRRNSNRQDRQMHDATCAECGVATQVPFKPVDDRPVYCSDCYSNQRNRR